MQLGQSGKVIGVQCCCW